MFTFSQNKSWFRCLIYLSAKARPMQWFNGSKTIHNIAFLKKLPISDTVTYIMWCWSKMKCVYLTMSDNDFDTPLDFPQSDCDNYPEAEENSAWKLLDRWQLVPSRLQALGIVVGFCIYGTTSMESIHKGTWPWGHAPPFHLAPLTLMMSSLSELKRLGKERAIKTKTKKKKNWGI